MRLSDRLKEIQGHRVYINDENTPWITIYVDDDEGARGEITEVGEDYVELRYKRRLRKDKIVVVPIRNVIIVSDA